MTLTAQNAIFAYGPQSAKGVTATTFYRHKATMIGFGVNDDARLGPLEIGSSPFPTFPYKAGFTVGGPVAFIPRMSNVFGWIPYGMLGDVTPSNGGVRQVETATVAGTISTAGNAAVVVTKSGMTGSPITLNPAMTLGWNATQIAAAIRSALLANANITAAMTIGGSGTSIVATAISPAANDATFNISIDNDTSAGITTATTSANTTAGSIVAGTYENAFHPLASDKSVVRWMTLRKYIPPADGVATTDLGEEFTDCKPVGMSLAFETEQPVQCQMDFLGTAYSMTGDVSGWSYANTYEEWQSIPVGCALGGGVTFTGGGMVGQTLKAVRAVVNFQNTPLDAREEKIIGTPGLEDVTILERRVTFDVTVKFSMDLYLAILTGSTTGTAWSATPFTGALDLNVVSTQNIPGTAVPYSLKLTAPSVQWTMNGAPQLAAGRAVTMRFQGTALEPTSGDYFTLSMINGQNGYTWPA